MAHSTRTSLLAVALALPLAVCGCGGGGGDTPGGLDRNDPEAVARAYIATYYDCGDKGAGLRWDLEIHEGGEDEPTRAEALAGERQDGCRPTRVPTVQTFLGGSRGDISEVVIVNPDACEPDKVILTMARGAGGDYSVQHGGDYDDSACVRHGSTG